MRGYNIDDYVGQRFNHLTLIKNSNKLNKDNSKLALFRCDCGNEKEIVFTQVLKGEVKTCGCQQGVVSFKSKEKRKKTLFDFYSNKTMKNNKTGFTGISLINNKYRVRIQVNHKSIHVRLF